MKYLKLLIIFMFLFNTIYGQDYSGYVLNKKTNLPVEYSNIGIPGKKYRYRCRQ